MSVSLLRHLCAPLSFFALLAASPTAALAQEEADDAGWSNQTLLTWVMTGCNSTTRTLGLNNVLEWRGPLSKLRISAGAIRSEASSRAITAVGPSPASFTVNETTDTELTAESFFARSRYERDLSARQFLFGGIGWDRNTFAGIDSRYTLVAGTGYRVIDRESTQFSVDLGLTYSAQNDVIEVTGGTDSFAGLRFGWELVHALTSTTTFTSDLVLDENLDATSDVRFDLLNALAVQMSDLLSLKTSLQLFWDNEPALQGLPLEFPAGTPLGPTVLVPLDKLDTVFTLGLSIDI